MVEARIDRPSQGRAARQEPGGVDSRGIGGVGGVHEIGAYLENRERWLEHERWFWRGLRAEENGSWHAAAQAYRAALRLGRTPDVHFNLGNVLSAQGRLTPAVQAYRRALALDRGHAEAWNNLGNALADLGKTLPAVRAYQKALAARPGYADAHYNIAVALCEAGRTFAAVRHWRAYLRQDPEGLWADRARARLRSVIVEEKSDPAARQSGD